MEMLQRLWIATIKEIQLKKGKKGKEQENAKKDLPSNTN
jgi:hypothetical protein